MGRITIFVKSRCKYCEKLRAFIKEAVQAHVLPFRNQLKPYYGIELCLVNVSADAARSAQCIALTGSRTVPQAFLNEEHIGNERTCTVFDQCGELAKKLRSLATKPSAAFPPEPEAAFVKLTSDMAFASQPTLAQIRGLSEFGFQSVVNLVHERERGHLRSEGVVATAAGLQYLPAAPREPPSIPISHIEVDVIPGLPMPGSGTVPPCLGGRASQGTCQAPSRADAETKESSGSTAASMASHRRRRHVGRRLSADDAAGAKAALEAAAAAAESHPCPAAGHGGMSGPETCCPRAGDAYDARLDLDLEEVGGGGGGAGGGAGGGQSRGSPLEPASGPGGVGSGSGGVGGLATGPGPSTGQAPLDAIIEEEEAAAATRGVTVEDWGSPPASARCRIGASTGGTSVATPVSGDGSGSPGRGGGTRGCSEGPSDPPVARSVTASSGTAPFGPEDAGPRGSVKKAPRDQEEQQQDDSDAADGKADSDESAPRDSPLGSRRPTGASSGAPESATGVAASDAGHTVSSFEPSTVWTMRHDDLAGRPALAMRAVRGAASGSAAESGDSGGAVARRFLRDAMSAAPSEAATLDSPRLGPFGASRTPDFGPAEPPMLADVHPPGEEDGPVWTPEWCRAAIEKVDAARKPVLVHCQTGVAACAVCLIRAARQLKSTPKQVARWAADLGHRIADHGDLEQCVAVLLSEA